MNIWYPQYVMAARHCKVRHVNGHVSSLYVTFAPQSWALVNLDREFDNIG